jgi:predicted nucleic-acid-binding Zn-ribbon protein
MRLYLGRPSGVRSSKDLSEDPAAIGLGVPDEPRAIELA